MSVATTNHFMRIRFSLWLCIKAPGESQFHIYGWLQDISVELQDSMKVVKINTDAYPKLASKYRVKVCSCSYLKALQVIECLTCPPSHILNDGISDYFTNSTTFVRPCAFD